MKIPFNKPSVVGNEIRYIGEAIENCHLSGDGPFTKKCNKWLEENLKCKKAFLTHSCTAALEMAAILCDIQPGDEVIMPSFTFVSTANAFVLRGGVPVFVDIRPDTLNINEKLIKAAITSKTKAIVPVHYAGSACAMDEIIDIAKRNNLTVIEDAAQSILSTYKRDYLGSVGHLGCLSFHETKNIISGEGGALFINDPKYIERAEIIREKGTNRSRFLRGQIDKYTWVDIGSSYLPSELIAAFLYAQFEEADKIISARRRLWGLYGELLKPLEDNGFIKLPHVPSDCISNGHLFYVIARSLDERTRLSGHLRKRDINAVFHYVPLHSSLAGLKFGRVSGKMDITNEISDRLMRLPLFYGMLDNEVEYVSSSIQDFYERII